MVLWHCVFLLLFCFITFFLNICLPRQHCLLKNWNSFDCWSVAILAHYWQKCPCFHYLGSCVWWSDPAHTELDYFLLIYLETIFTTFYQLSPTLNIPDITQFLSWSFRCSCFSYLVLLVSCFLPCFSAKLFSQWCSKVVHPLLIFFFNLSKNLKSEALKSLLSDSQISAVMWLFGHCMKTNIQTFKCYYYHINFVNMKCLNLFCFLMDFSETNN